MALVIDKFRRSPNRSWWLILQRCCGCLACLCCRSLRYDGVSLNWLFVSMWSKERSHSPCRLFKARPKRKQLKVRSMSFTRNRSQSSDSPNVKPRALQLHLQGAQDTLKAFDGYHSTGPVLQASVLERPTGRPQVTVLQRLVERVSHFARSIVRLFRWSTIDQWFISIERLTLLSPMQACELLVNLDILRFFDESTAATCHLQCLIQSFNFFWSHNYGLRSLPD